MRTGIRVLTAVIGGTLAMAMAGPLPVGASSCSVPLFAYRSGTVSLSEGGHATRVHVQIADTPDRQQTGLMCRNTLDPDAGMLFVFPTPTDGAFWMKNTLIPLAIAFINTNWHIVRIMEMPVAPDPTAEDPGKFPLYDPHMPYRYALEVNAGFFKVHGISEHAEVRFTQEGSRLPRSPSAITVP
jgi:hypothetical protein